MAMIPRTLTAPVIQALGRAPVVFVNGPRQAGKSTLVNAIARKAWPARYVTLDDPTTMLAVRNNPETFLRLNDGPLIVDEVQLAPALFRALKLIVDEGRAGARKGRAAGRYLLTGSANIMVLPDLADALVGRMAVLTLYPLSATEVARAPGLFLPALLNNGFAPNTERTPDRLVDMMRRATFPEITGTNDKARRAWFDDYIATLLQRDVRQIADIERLALLPNLLRLIASRAGGLINEADLARSLGINAVTAKSYRVLLNMMFLTFEVRPWFRNVGKRLVKSPKSYFTDTAMLCHLLHVDLKAAAERDPPLFGRVLENFVASELTKQLSHGHDRAQLLHYRTSDGQEVDFVIERSNGEIAAIEVKTRDNIDANDFKVIADLRDRAGKDFICGVVLYRGRNVVPFGDRLWAVPIAQLWA